jgi:hypothetical protein
MHVKEIYFRTLFGASLYRRTRNPKFIQKAKNPEIYVLIKFFSSTFWIRKTHAIKSVGTKASNKNLQIIVVQVGGTLFDVS